MRRGAAPVVAALLGATLLMTACAPRGDAPTGPMAAILRSHSGLEPVVAAAPEYRLQAVLGRVEDGPDGPRLVQHGFRLDAEYFYPASSVKLFAAVAALERLAELRRETGLFLDADTPLVFHPLFEDEELEDADDSNLEGGRITVRHEIRKLFLVSDNRAFNRLYELVGQDRLAASLSRAGLGGARVVHRLSEFRSAQDNRRFPRIDSLAPAASGAGDGGEVIYTLPENAWVVDRRTGHGFFLAATLYTNADGVLNDDEYEYETVALPFLADLGEAAGRWEWGSDGA